MKSYFKLLLLVATFPLFFSGSYPSEITVNDKSAFNTILGFTSDLPVFTNAGSENALNYFAGIIDYFEDQDGRHAYDLFDGETGILKDIQAYLFEDIIHTYSNEVKVEFDGKNIKIDKIKDDAGETYIRYVVEKSISYKGKKKKIKNAILIHEGSSKINLVQISGEEEKTNLPNLAMNAFNDGDYEKAAYYYKKAVADNPLDNQLAKQLNLCQLINTANGHYENKKYNLALESYQSAQKMNKLAFFTSQIKNCEQYLRSGKKSQFILTIDKANIAFNKGDFNTAQDLYASASKLNPADQYSNERQQICITIQQADQLYKKADYSKAIRAYEAIKNHRSITYVTTKIADCKSNIQFDRYKKQGDHFYQKDDYESAKEAYTTALSYKADAGISTRLKTFTNAAIQQKNKQIAAEIRQAKARVKKSGASGKDWFKTFSTLYKYEGTGKLDGQAYYIMGIALYANYGNIVGKMKLKSKVKQLYISYLTKAFLADVITEKSVEYQLIKPKHIKRIKNELRKLK